MRMRTTSPVSVLGLGKDVAGIYVGHANQASPQHHRLVLRNRSATA
jgi:hypothetical protein